MKHWLKQRIPKILWLIIDFYLLWMWVETSKPFFPMVNSKTTGIYGVYSDKIPEPWLVGGWWFYHPSQKYESIGMMMKFPIWMGKCQIHGNQTTNQHDIRIWTIWTMQALWLYPALGCDIRCEGGRVRHPRGVFRCYHHFQFDTAKNMTKKNNSDWLVVWTPLKNMKVNWDDEIPNIWENAKFMATKPPTSSESYLEDIPKLQNMIFSWSNYAVGRPIHHVFRIEMATFNGTNPVDKRNGRFMEPSRNSSP